VNPLGPRAALRGLGRVAGIVLPALLAIMMAAPVVYIATGGFRTTGQIASDPVALPDPWQMDNYADVTSTDSPFWTQLRNSTFIAVMTTVGVTLLGAHVAFALSRMEFRGREAVYAFFTAGLLFPLTVAALPLYIQLRDWDMLNNPWGIIFPQVAFGLPITVIILRPFMRAIPGELEDAAAIDGCGRIGFFWRILLPNCWPALTTVAVLAFITSWNAYLLPKLVLDDRDAWTLPQGVHNYSTQYTADTAGVMAFTAISMLPALCFFLVLERKLVAGLTGAVKG
jgi:raffinose/stachyose/melibiose transport system permease protein